LDLSYRTHRYWEWWIGERNWWSPGRLTGRWGSVWPSSACWRKVTPSDCPDKTSSVAPSLNGCTSFTIRTEIRYIRTCCAMFSRGRHYTPSRIRRYQNLACVVRKISSLLTDCYVIVLITISISSTRLSYLVLSIIHSFISLLMPWNAQPDLKSRQLFQA